MIQTIQFEKLRLRVETDAKTFQESKPYPHIVFDDLLVDGIKDQVSAAFPTESWQAWSRFSDKLQFEKLSCDDSSQIPEPLDRIIYELNSGPVMKWLEQLSGTHQLLPDPWLTGGGLHSSGPGGFLLPHIDFHRVNIKNYYRRLNLLLYLNDGWKEENGGCLELWDKDKDVIVKKVLPEFGRCVIFRTDFHSLHGFSTPVSGRFRNSIALYYYTAYETANEFSGDDSTHWRLKSLGDKSMVHNLQRAAYWAFMAASSRFSRLAWKVNPNREAKTGR